MVQNKWLILFYADNHVGMDSVSNRSRVGDLRQALQVRHALPVCSCQTRAVELKPVTDR